MSRQLKIIPYLVLLFVGPSAPALALKYPPTFITEPVAMTLSSPSNQSVTLECQATGIPKPMYYWKKNGQVFSVRNSSRISQTPGIGSLVFERLQETDEGAYRCYAENQYGRLVSNEIRIKKTESGSAMPTSGASLGPFWVHTPNDTLDCTSRKLSFECHAGGTPPPTIEWLKNGYPLQSNDRIEVNHTKLTIESVLGDIDTAVYQCNASNSVGSLLKNFYVNALKFAPTILKSPAKQVTAMSGTDTELTCQGDGSPMPNIKWEKDNFPISNGSKFIVNEGYLKITNISSKDAGIYRCIAYNRQGNDFRSIEFAILNATKIVNPPVNQKVSLGSMAIFHCTAVVDCNLNVKTEWKFNGRRLDPSANPADPTGFSRLTLAPDNSTLQIDNITQSDLGPYTCTASTELDSVSATAQLLLQRPPGAPRISKVTCNGILASIEWVPTEDNGSPILSYDIQLSNNFEPHVWTSKFPNISAIEKRSGRGNCSQRFIIPLKPWTRYSFRVLARNALGLSEPSLAYGFCSTKSFPPFKHPENVTARAGETPGSLIINWNEIPQTEHNAEGFLYKIFWKPADEPDARWNRESIPDWRETFLALEGLPAYKEFKIRVETRNSKGHPSCSATEIIARSREGKPSSPPEGVTLVKLLNSTSALVSWNSVPESTLEGPFKGYKVLVKSENGTLIREKHVEGNETKVLLNGLAGNSTNVVHVIVMNSLYESDPSAELQISTKLEAQAGFKRASEAPMQLDVLPNIQMNRDRKLMKRSLSVWEIIKMQVRLGIANSK